MSANMKRRQFLTLLGGAAAAWPLVVRAQQAERVRQVGFLSTLAENESTVAGSIKRRI